MRGKARQGEARRGEARRIDGFYDCFTSRGDVNFGGYSCLLMMKFRRAEKTDVRSDLGLEAFNYGPAWVMRRRVSDLRYIAGLCCIIIGPRCNHNIQPRPVVFADILGYQSYA